MMCGRILLPYSGVALLPICCNCGDPRCIAQRLRRDYLSLIIGLGPSHQKRFFIGKN